MAKNHVFREICGLKNKPKQSQFFRIAFCVLRIASRWKM